jgi:diguanylate cyclase (GGDEF)-like protein
MAHHDMLTGLVNRALLLDRVEHALLRVKRTESPVAVLFFDLDNFKFVNDVFGHDAGDNLLKLVAERLRQGVRQEDTVARLGGDEFVVLLAEPTDEQEAQGIMQRMIDDVRQPMLVSGQEFRPSASGGMALFPRDGKTARELLRSADLAMYAAKHLRKSAEAQAVEAEPAAEAVAARVTPL